MKALKCDLNKSMLNIGYDGAGAAHDPALLYRKGVYRPEHGEDIHGV